MYQCTRFSTDPRLSHEWAITRIRHYLIETLDYRLIFRINKSKRLECFIDADFAGG
jgi:hypothetical protein